MEKYCIDMSLNAEIKNRDFYSFTGISGGYLIYSQMIKYIFCDRPEAFNMNTKQVEAIDIKELANVYTNAYDIGRKQFHAEIKPDASTEYLLNLFNDYYNGWKRTSEQINHIVSEVNIYNIGINSGIRYEFEIYREKKSKEFEALERLSDHTSPFAGLLRDLDDKQLDKLFEILKTGYKYTIQHSGKPKETIVKIKYIDTDINCFKYVFGGKDKPANFQPIKFLENKQILRQILAELQKEVKYNKQNPDTRELSNEIVKQTPKYFIDKNNKPFELPNNNKKHSNPELIQHILATI